MNDNDLIRRGNALEICQEFPDPKGIEKAIAALPAVSAPDVAELVEAANVAENMIIAALPLTGNPTSAQAFGLAHGRDRLRAALAKIGGQ